MLNYS